MNAPVCPGCGGDVWVDRRLGVLAHHDRDDCEIKHEEDQQEFDDRSACGLRTTHSLDYERDDHRQFGSMFVRPSTSAERALALACGADPVAVARTLTAVHYLSGSVRRRVLTSVQLSGLPGVPSVDPRLVR